MKINEVTESLDQPAKWRWMSQSFDSYRAEASIVTADDLSVSFDEIADEEWEISFSREAANGHHTSIATRQGSEFVVFATVVDIITSWWTDISSDGYRPIQILFSANKQVGDSPRRAKLYTRFAKQFATKIGYHMTTNDNSEHKVVFNLTLPDS
jgi:hypothetical protein